MEERYTAESIEDTRSIGGDIARGSVPGDVFALNGDLGAGKTEFVRGFTKYLIPDAVVRSPSFPLIVSYYGESIDIHHFDFYRLIQPDELFEIGYYEYLENGQDIIVIEWAEMLPEEIPENAVRIDIKSGSQDNQRKINIIRHT